ncbi:MAG: methyltransferase domain-containing protein [Calditrichaeota bacterium]|nr:methyltransferase domain-containing protein [Calditrichota bacterium]
MVFKYNSVVPWGRNYGEYLSMFDLREHRLKILGCGDGPASFNEEYTRKGGTVVSVDPLYHLSAEKIRQRIEETREDILRQTEQNRELFVWDRIRSVEELGKIRMAAMNIFLSSYEEGRKNKRYIPASLPDLPFEDDEFDLALSSHFLFLYTDNLSYEFHKRALTEMLRVAKEARIFPLLDFNAKKSSYVEKVLSDFGNHRIEIRKVDYEFQISGNELMVIRKA